MFGNIISIFFFYKTGICERWRSYLALETNVNIMDTCKKMNYIVELKYCIYLCHSRCFGIRGGHGKSAFKLAVKLSVELGYVFLSLRL
jgi:hypothetical protein